MGGQRCGDVGLAVAMIGFGGESTSHTF
eukprot:SAG31_NODE_48019_length_200_cov_44.029703_1_plen_27_part_01